MKKEEKETKDKKKMVVVEEVVPESTEEVKEEVEEVKEPEQVTETEEESSYDRPNYLWIIIPTALLVGALVGGFITYFSGLSKMSEESVVDESVSSVPTAEPEPSPVASPSSEVDRSKVKIEVLNGSGVAGAAGKAKAVLESAGYEDIDVGNASSSDFDTTEISIKASANEYLETLVADLSDSYEVSDKTTTLSSSNKYDIIVTLGKK